jgi:hypothetical protein
LVKPTNDGMELLDEQGFDIDQADGSVSSINSKCSFYEYSLDKLQAARDVRAVTSWCLILIYFVAMREFFSVLSSWMPNAFIQIYGFDFQLFNENYESNYLNKW